MAKQLSRREFLHISAVTTLGTVLAACGPAPTPERVEVEKVVTQEVERTVEVEKIVTPTPAPGPESRIGRDLIGELEGPEIITDPAQFPTTFNEAPQLAGLVASGALPPVEERLPKVPLVVKPVHEIGKYGGTWRRGFTGPGDKWNGQRAGAHDTLVYWDYEQQDLVPNIAQRWEVADDGLSLTFHLREGMKWSDGHPFTADDIMFWYEDFYLNDDIIPAPYADMMLGDEPVTVEKIDDYTVRYNFPAPYYFFVTLFAATGQATGGPGAKLYLFQGGYAPAHYLKQFHPRYTPQAELDKQVQEAGFDSWLSMLKFKCDWTLDPDLPVVTAWKTTNPINTSVWVLERNPYSIWVDTEGNQLPYLDSITLTLAESSEVINLRAIAGEYDFQARHILIENLPVFLENQEKGGYKVCLDPADSGSDAMFSLNLGYDADPEIAKWLNNRDFRRALSLGVERDQINEACFLGLGIPSTIAPIDTNKYFPGPEYRTLWATYEPEKANEMLDGIGLDKKDADGYRLRTDGGGRLTLEVTIFAGQFANHVKICEMVREQWKEIGIALDIQEVERSLGATRISNNEHQMWIWDNTGTESLFINNYIVPMEVGGYQGLGNVFAKWFVTNGAEGKEPPPRMREAMELHRKGKASLEEERIEIGKEIWRICVDEVWEIGLVGFAAAATGCRVANVNLGNVPARQVNTVNVRTPGLCRPETFFWKV